MQQTYIMRHNLSVIANLANKIQLIVRKQSYCGQKGKLWREILLRWLIPNVLFTEFFRQRTVINWPNFLVAFVPYIWISAIQLYPNKRQRESYKAIYFAAGSELALLISQQTFLTYTLFDFCMNYISASGSGLLSLLKGTV